MRVKSDAVPGKFTYVTFTPVKVGEYITYCTEYCGKDHWNMLATLSVVSQEDYERWLNDRSAELAMAGLGPAERGGALYTQKGCNACHSLDGSKVIGPSFLKLFGREGELADGTRYVADENYIKTSILNPNSQIVKGFAPAMPSYEGQLDDDQIASIIAFIKTVDGSQKVAAPEPAVETAEETADLTPEQRGERLYNSKTCVVCHSIDGSRLVGPTFKGLVGRSGEFESGESYVADEEYIRGSIKEPNKDTVKSYPAGGMPMIPLTDEEIDDLIAYMKTLK